MAKPAVLHMRLVMPWWRHLYVWGFWLFDATTGMGDVDVAVDFLVRHTRIVFTCGRRQWVEPLR